MLQTNLKEKLLGLTTYPQELGLDIKHAEYRFKWFLAAMLFVLAVENLPVVTVCDFPGFEI